MVMSFLPPVKRGRKYHNKRVVLPDGQTFDSRAEYRHWLFLSHLAKEGRITKLARQVPFSLAPAVVLKGRKKPALRYVADFTYTDTDGKFVVADVKGVSTAEWRIKQHLMMSVYGIEVLEVRS